MISHSTETKNDASLPGLVGSVFLPCPIIKIRERNPTEESKIQVNYRSISPLLSQLLAARGFQANEELEEFLLPSEKSFSDERLSPSINKFSELLADILQNNLKVVVTADFDVDGVSSAVQLINFFDKLGIESRVIFPNRHEEGYGLNERIIRDALGFGSKVIICVDFGTTNSRELNFARENGIRTVVIDHHERIESVIPSDLVVNPEGVNYATSDLVFRLIYGVTHKLRGSRSKLIPVYDYLQIATLGTICDLVPLLGPNHSSAKLGLQYISQQPYKGLRELCRLSGIEGEVSSEHISFRIGPRLNAAGRLASADLAFDALQGDPAKAQIICQINDKRKVKVAEVFDDATMKLVQQEYLPDGIVSYSPYYELGVVGIAAQRLVDRFYRPTLVMGKDKSGNISGSIRTISGISVIKIIEELKPTLLKGGGHIKAGGCTVRPENFEALVSQFEAACSRQFKNVSRVPVVVADFKMNISELTDQFIADLKHLEPFGMDNPPVHICIEGALVENVEPFGKEHMCFQVWQGGRYGKILLWHRKSHPLVRVGERINMVVTSGLGSSFTDTSSGIPLEAKAIYKSI